MPNDVAPGDLLRLIAEASEDEIRAIVEGLPDDVCDSLANDWGMWPLIDFVPAVNPGFSAPRHLAPFCEALDRALSGERIRALVTLPPGSGKTTTALSGLVKGMRTRPGIECLYATYNQDQARDKSIVARDIAIHSGGILRPDQSRKDLWELENGAKLRAVGAGGAATGNRFDIGIIDDPLKDSEEARSTTVKNARWRWIWSVLETRVREHSSIFLMHTRWAEDDPIGRMETMIDRGDLDDTWIPIHLPALDENDESLIPWYSTAFFHKLRSAYRAAGLESMWWSLYMGAPRPPDGSTFRGTRTFESLPASGLVWGTGVDFAYSKKTTADYNAIVVGAMNPRTKIVYVVHVERWRGGQETHQPRVDKVKRMFPQAFRRPAIFRGSGPEKGGGDAVRGVVWRSVSADKVARAQPVSGAWNTYEDDDGTTAGGRVLVPESAKGSERGDWCVEVDGEATTYPVDVYLQEMHAFPAGANDDMVDGTASMYEALGLAAGSRVDFDPSVLTSGAEKPGRWLGRVE